MTKLTQQQRREKKKQCKQTHVSEHDEFVLSNIKFVYPNANVINMTDAIHSYENVISHAKKRSNSRKMIITLLLFIILTP